MHWAAGYIGIPYVRGGEARDGADCWGLVRLVLREQCGLDMPAISVGEAVNARAIRAAFVGWARVEKPRAFDVVTMRDPFGHHVGIIAKADEWTALVLHCAEPQSTIISFAAMGLLGYKDFRIWRHHGGS